jgi:subfamily B ATP-binding cassette protein MsbA
MQYFKQIIHYARPYIGYAGLNVFFNILYALFSALAFVSFIPMLDVLFQQTNTNPPQPQYNGLSDIKNYIQDLLNYQVAQLLAEDVDKTLIFVIGLVLVLFFLKNLFNYFALYFIAFLRNGVLKDLRNSLYKKVISLPVGYFTEQRKGDLMARMASDVLEIQTSFLSVLELLIREPLTIIFTLLVMFNISWPLTLFVVIFIPTSGIIISIIGKQLRKKSDLVQKEQGQILSIIDETINGQKVIKTFNATERFISRFAASTQRFYKFSNALVNRNNLAAPTSEFLGIAIIGVLLWFGGSMVLLEQSLDGTTFIVFMGLAYNILTPAKGISKALFSIRKGDAAAARVVEILTTDNPLKDHPKAENKNSFQRDIVFENVTFSYGNGPVVKDFSLTIKKGETIALVGHSGSGKTTIANLLNRFYDINSGALLVDGTPINKIKKESLYSLIGVVTQEAILFNDSVENNLKLGQPNATEEQVITAAKAAYAHQFIQELPEGYKANIGEGGSKLSGGQKQRLSIARAVLKNPQILILDEATSALDTTSEKSVQQALENLMKKRTSLVIAHRLSTIQKADRILVLDKGAIVESGSHDVLLKKGKVYKSWVALQKL